MKGGDMQETLTFKCPKLASKSRHVKNLHETKPNRRSNKI